MDDLTPSTGDENTGVVAKDSKGNEWVWVEVPKSIYITAKNDTDYTNIYMDMKIYVESVESGYINVEDIDTDRYISGSGNFSSEEEYNQEKNRMLKSVYDNGGFWISRYEIGTFNAAESVEKDTANVTTPVSQQNAYPIVNKTQPQSQQIVRKLNDDANLLFGIQWKLTLKFLLLRGALTSDEIYRDSSGWGNHLDSSFKIDRGKYQKDDDWDSTNWITLGSEYKEPETNENTKNNYLYKRSFYKLFECAYKLTTGAADRNCKMNIYDLAGNVEEWTLENDDYYLDEVVFRGGDGGLRAKVHSVLGTIQYIVNVKMPAKINWYNCSVGFRAALY